MPNDKSTSGVTTSSDRRTQLLLVAMKLFSEKGYHATSISDIIESASVARGTFYNYFENKRQIFEQLLDEIFKVLVATTFPIRTNGPESVPDQVRRMIHSIVEKMMQNLAITRIILEKAVGLDAGAQAKLQSFYGSVFGRLKEAVEDGQEMGIIRKGDSAVISACILGTLKEPVYQHSLGTVSLTTEQIVDSIFDIVYGGFLSSNK